MESYDFYSTVASVLAVLPFCQKALIYRMLQRGKVCPTITSIFARDIWSSFWLIVWDLFLPSWPGPFFPECRYKPDRQLKESSRLCRAFSILKLLGALWFQKHSKPYKMSHILVLIYVLPKFDYRNQQTVSLTLWLDFFFVPTMRWVIKVCAFPNYVQSIYIDTRGLQLSSRHILRKEDLLGHSLKCHRKGSEYCCECTILVFVTFL